MAGSTDKKKGRNTLVSNRRARRDYEVIESFETGIELRGTEVKALREGHASIQEAFGSLEGRELFLLDMTVQPYAYGNVHNHDPVRPRRLLLHRREITRLIGQVQQKGLTLIPLKIYLKGPYLKVELALCRGKNTLDKRETIKRRSADRDMQRALRNARR
jgi:SsrA-binding protein